MKRYKLSLNSNPSFSTVTGLTNTTFNISSYLENRMATEEQISQLYNRIVEEETRRDQCCRDIIIWEAHVQVVRMNTLDLTDYNNLRGGGEVISSFDENVSVGTMRRGLPYTITFPLKWDNSTYVPRDVVASSQNNCGNSLSSTTSSIKLYTNYRIIQDNSIVVSNCTATTNTVKGFWYVGQLLSSTNNNQAGHYINSNNVWDNFVHQMANDGTVTIKDLRRNTNFNIIRYYTQWILRQTANGQIIPDPTLSSP